MLQNLEAQPEKLPEALALSAAFHVMEIGMLEEWLGHGLIVAWTGHADYPAEAMSVSLVELISEAQADPGEHEAVNSLAEHQRAILQWEASVEL